MLPNRKLGNYLSKFVKTLPFKKITTYEKYHKVFKNNEDSLYAIIK